MTPGEMFELIKGNDLDRLREALTANPALVNEGVTLDNRPAKGGHPLHRICDAVFARKITDEQAIAIAKIFMEHGSDIDGYMSQGDNNTPLIAAASLGGEKLSLFYIEHGANIFYAPQNDGATALHWAAFCGRDKLVERLIEKGADINRLDTNYHSTPCGWAIHVLESADTDNPGNQLSCVKLLLKAGTDKKLLYPGSIKYLEDVAEADPELKKLLE
ncbi:MAG TPA: ankyrin repeat domain-containing protein [Mucilaginibacter sp.]|nr:ankyrin repeat domain-containing protein [Mucilaginibacter sp.]